MDPATAHKGIPQGLKPASIAAFIGTTEVVPFQSRFMRSVL